MPASVEKSAEKPAGSSAEQAAKPSEKPPASRVTDDLGLPLVFVIEAPEVPPEIRGPSPPIQAEPAP